MPGASARELRDAGNAANLVDLVERIAAPWLKRSGTESSANLAGGHVAYRAKEFGADGWIRTSDQGLMSPLLCH